MKACLPTNQCTVPENTKLLQDVKVYLSIISTYSYSPLGYTKIDKGCGYIMCTDMLLVTQYYHTIGWLQPVSDGISLATTYSPSPSRLQGVYRCLWPRHPNPALYSPNQTAITTLFVSVCALIQSIYKMLLNYLASYVSSFLIIYVQPKKS